MIAAFLLAAIAIDLALVELAARPAGFARALGPLHLRLHDPSALLIVLAILTGAFVMACWQTRARNSSFAALPVVTAAAGLLLTRHAVRMFPFGDIAVIELYVRNALTGALLVGPYSRFGWHHPGPLYFYVLAGPYAAAGRTTAALAAGAALINVGSVALLVWIAIRAFGTRSTWALLYGVAVYLLMTPGLAVSPWNPHIVILPLFVLLAASAAAAAGDHAMLPIVAVFASFVMQADVALAPVVLTVSAAALISYARGLFTEQRRRALRTLNITAWTIAALWIVPVAEELTRSPGNLTLLWRFFSNEHGQGQTWRTAFETWTATFGAHPGAPGGLPASDVALATGAVFRAPGRPFFFDFVWLELALLIFLGWRVRRVNTALSWLTVICLVAAAAALWSITRIEGEIMDHQVFWISGLGTFCVFVGAVDIFTGYGNVWLRRFPRARWPGLGHAIAIAFILGVSFSQLDRARQGRLPVTTNNPVVERLTGSVRQYLESQAAHKPLVRIGENDWGLTAGVLLDLDRGRIPFAVERDWMPMFPESFAANGEEDAEVAFGNGDEHEQRMRVPGATAIASFAPLYIDGLPLRR